jgi:hypothetical protein
VSHNEPINRENHIQIKIVQRTIISNRNYFIPHFVQKSNFNKTLQMLKMLLPAFELLLMDRQTDSHVKVNARTSRTVRREHVKKKCNDVYAVQCLAVL